MMHYPVYQQTGHLWVSGS